jgi:TniQ
VPDSTPHGPGVHRSRPQGPVSILCQPMPDEPVLGHLGRIAILNSYPSIERMSLALDKSTLVGGKTARAALRSLACVAAGMPLETYAIQHSMIPFLRNVEHPAGMRLSKLCGKMLRNQYRRINQRPRCCIACMEADVRNHGFSWFRRTHDLSGVPWCLVHDTTLQEVHADHVHCACPHIWRDRQLLKPCAAHWDRLSKAPSLVRRYVDALLSLSTRPEPLNAEHLYALLCRSAGSIDQDRTLSAYSLFKRFQSKDLLPWFNDFGLHKGRGWKIVISELDFIEDFYSKAQHNSAYALAIAALHPAANAEIRKLMSWNPA